MLVVLIFLSQPKVKTEEINKIMLELLTIIGIIVAIRIFLYKKVSLQPNFETISKVLININIMDRTFSIYIIIRMHTEILSYNRVTRICEKCPKEIGKARNLIFCFHY